MTQLFDNIKEIKKSKFTKAQRELLDELSEAGFDVIEPTHRNGNSMAFEVVTARGTKFPVTYTTKNGISVVFKHPKYGMTILTDLDIKGLQNVISHVH